MRRRVGFYQRACARIISSTLLRYVSKHRASRHPPCPKITKDDTGSYFHTRLRVTLPPLVEGTVGLPHARVGNSIRAIGRVTHVVGRSGDWDLHLEQIERAT
jgi:hypothetical protein